MNAIHILFGSDWAYVIYPILGATLALWILMTLWTGPLADADRKTRIIVAGSAFAFIAIDPTFLFHSLFVHSHMFSALYLLMSVTCIWLAYKPDPARREGKGEAAHLMLAGVFAGGFALARPDALAYMFIPVVVAISALSCAPVRVRSVAAFFAPLLAIVFTVYGAAFIALGMWRDSKLSGRMALAILALLALSASGPWIVQWLDRVSPVRLRGERFLAIIVSAAAVLMLAVAALKWDNVVVVLANARVNLFQGAGGYQYLWYAIVVVLVLSLLTRDALRPGSWTRPAFLSIALFFIVAGIIHGTSHPGRIGATDSFNRVMFHVVPLIVWYAGAVAARILGPAGVAEQT